MNPTCTIVGLCGKKRAGKDTIGNYLVQKHGFYRLAFADPLKVACQEIFGLSHDQTWGDEKDTIDPYWKHSPRELFQTIGTDLLRKNMSTYCPNITENIWIKSMDRKIQMLIKKGYQKFVITDVRFPDEFDYVKHGFNEDAALVNIMQVPVTQPNFNRYMWKVSRQPTQRVQQSTALHSTEASTALHSTEASTALHSSEISLDICAYDHEFVNNQSLAALHANIETVYQTTLL